MKVLVTNGLYSNKNAIRVSELVSLVKSADEICDITGLSKSCVNKYIPYTKWTYMTDETEKSTNALRIKKYRARIE